MLKPNIAKLAGRSGEGPAISIIMPTFRRPQAIGATISSLLNGSWKDFELLVRDDGDGQDGTEVAVAEAANDDPRVQYHRNKQTLRMPANLNAGIQASRGKFIAVCHDHDLYKPTFIQQMVGTLRRHPTALFVHCAIETINQNGEVTQTHIGEWPELTAGADWLRYMLRSLNCPVCALTVVRREAHELYGLYDLSCGFIADVEMWMRLSTKGDVAYVRDPLIQVREREKDHVEQANGHRWISMAAKIHRRFLPIAFPSNERALRRLMLELSLSKQYLRHRAARVANRV